MSEIILLTAQSLGAQALLYIYCLQDLLESGGLGEVCRSRAKGGIAIRKGKRSRTGTPSKLDAVT